MDRFYPNDLKVKELKRAFVEAKKTDNQGGDKKQYVITTTDLLSFLYIDDINTVGDKKERVVRGRVIDIVSKSQYNIKGVQPNYATYFGNATTDQTSQRTISNTRIIVDSSTDHNSSIEELKVENILDVQPIDYPWNLNENPDLLPHEGDGLKYYEPERWNEIKNETSTAEIINEDYL